MSQKTYAQGGDVSFQVFYDNLSPYGSWVDYPNYGYVWIPDVDPGFSPYATNGYWVYTDYGWTWVSNYPWGWAPFHYGRWDYDNTYGWFWIPGNEWAPAWVSWRRSPGYYGWAPLGPGISVTIAFGNGYHEPDNRWVFVRDGDITRHDVDRHYIDRSRNVTIIKNSTTIVNVTKDNRRSSTYIAGPARNDVQSVTHTQIKPVAIRENSKPGQHVSNGTLQIYRPQVQKTAANGRNPAPPKVVKLSDVKPMAQRSGGNKQRINSPGNNGKPQHSVVPQNNNGRRQQNVTPPNSRAKQQQQNVVPNNNRNNQSPNAAPPNNRKRQPHNNVTPGNNNGKHPQNAAPPNNRAKQPQNVNPNNNRKNPPQNVHPNNNREKQPQKTAPPKNNQPKANEKKPPDEKKRPGE